MYRRNTDENLRALERNAQHSDIDLLKYAVALSRTGMQLPPDMSKELRRIWRDEFELDRQLKREHGSGASSDSLMMRDIALINTDIFQDVVLDYGDRAHELYLIVKTMLQDMPHTAPLLDVATWLWDRREHRIAPDPHYNRIAEPRIPWFGFDAVDWGAGIYGSKVFPSTGALPDWHKLVRLIDITSRDPRVYRQPRPTEQEVINQVLDFFEETFGIEPRFPLYATPAPDIHDTSFRIYTGSPATGGKPLLLGTLYYQIAPGHNKFVMFKMELEHKFS